MMRRSIRLGLGLMLFAGTTHAADTFDALFKQAVATHPSVEGRRASLEAAKADKEGADWQLYPSPSFEATARNSGGNGGVLALEQPLWTGGRISAGIRAAGFREAAAEAAVVEAKLSTGLRLIAAYTEVLRLAQRQRFARQAVDEHNKLAELIDRRVVQEVSPPVDRDFAHSRLAQASTDLSLANQGAQVALVQLSQLVGRNIAAVDDVDMNGRAIPATLDEALKRAVDRSPVLVRLEQTALAVGQDIDVKRAALYPQVSFRLERQMGGIESTLPDNRALLVLRAQPGAGLSAASAIAAAQRRLDEARLAREEASRNVREQVQTAFAEWQAAQVRLTSTRNSASMAQLVFDSYSRQYATGRKTWIDVLNAVREISQSQFTLADAEALVRASALRLWLLTGEAPLGEPSGEMRRESKP
jgi:adhesin transport system outer membrane protein